MRASEAIELNARSRAAKSKKELHHLEIHPAENGGHTVEHHFSHDGMYREPENHAFGDGEHEKMLAHVANALKLPEPKEEEESSAGAAY